MEKRKHERIDLSYTISFKRTGTLDSWWDISNTRNMSMGGAIFYSSQPHRVNDLLDITLKLPNQKDLLYCKAHVKRCEGPIKDTFYKLAICFTEMSNKYVKKLKESIKFL